MRRRQSLSSCWPIRTRGGVRQPSGCCSSVRTGLSWERCERWSWSDRAPSAVCMRFGCSNYSRRLMSPSIELGLADPEPRVREAAIRLAEARLGRDPRLLNATLALAGDPDPMVRFQLAFSLGEIKTDPRAMSALAAIARKDATNQWTRTAVLSSIAGRPLALLDELARAGRLHRHARRASLARRAGVSGRVWAEARRCQGVP